MDSKNKQYIDINSLQKQPSSSTLQADINTKETHKNTIHNIKSKFSQLLGNNIEKIEVKSNDKFDGKFEFELTEKHIQYKNLSVQPNTTLVLDFVLGRILENHCEQPLSFSDSFIEQVKFIPEAIRSNQADIFETKINKQKRGGAI